RSAPGNRCRTIHGLERGGVKAVILRVIDYRFHEAAGSSLGCNPGHPVHVVRLPGRSRLGKSILTGWKVYQETHATPEMPFVALGRDYTLQTRELLQPVGLHIVRHVVCHLEGARTLLWRVSERSHAIELRLLQELEEGLEILLRFAREPHDAGGPYRHVGHCRTKAGELLAQSALPFRTTHAGENCVRCMLHRHVDVRH